MNVLSLFSGIGGLDLGLESLNWETVAFSEFDPKIAAKKNGRQYAADVFAARYPNAVSLGDIEQIVFDNLDASWKEAQGTRIDIIVGGFP